MTDFKVGDTVRLTGGAWGKAFYEIAGVGWGTTHKIVGPVKGGKGYIILDNKGQRWGVQDDGCPFAAEIVEDAVGIPAEVANPFEHQVRTILTELGDLIIEKNAKYGDAILNPMQIFSKQTPIERVKSRLDDKLSRIARGDGTGDEDTVLDLMGYLVLLKIAESADE